MHNTEADGHRKPTLTQRPARGEGWRGEMIYTLMGGPYRLPWQEAAQLLAILAAAAATGILLNVHNADSSLMYTVELERQQG
jgi:hypothetical protein